MARGPSGGSREGSDPLAPLLRWMADDRVNSARRHRRREASLLRQAGEGATWRALLVDLAERADPVTMATTIGQLRGTVAAVGDDFCALRRADLSTLLPLRAIGQVWVDHDLPIGFRGLALSPTLADALLELSTGRPVVRVHARAGTVRTGPLLRVGTDLVTLGGAEVTDRPVSCNLALIDAVTLS